MDVSAPPADPEDAAKWQMLAVIYVVLVLLLLIPLQIFWERRRRMTPGGYHTESGAGVVMSDVITVGDILSCFFWRMGETNMAQGTFGGLLFLEPLAGTSGSRGVPTHHGVSRLPY